MRLFVWAGGALFVSALALAAWTFVVVFGQARPFSGGTTVTYDLLLFTIFAAHHSLFARESAKRALRRTIPENAFRSVYVWVASALLIAVCMAWRRIGGLAYDVARPWSWGLHAVQALGAWLTVVGVRAIDPLELAGIHAPAAGAGDLQMSGAYGFVRHPLYLGWMLMAFAAPRMTGDRLTFAAVSSAYLLLAIPWEERSLERAFGARYAGYKRRVRWRVIPWVY